MSTRPPEPEPVPPADLTQIVEPGEIARRLGKLTVFRTPTRTPRIDTPGPPEAVTAAPGGRFPDQDLAAERYELLGEFARGGMGVVLRARDRVIGRELAIKVPWAGPGWGPAAEARFLREARITGQLQHPGVPPVYDVGRFADGRPFIAMRLVRGKPLDVVLAARPDRTRELGRWARVFEQVCQPVAYAHSKGVIHRDLKPHNVVISPAGHAWVLDWGLARVLHEDGDGPDDPAAEPPVRVIAADRTIQGAMLGTPGYMAPEQAGDDPSRVDERSDVFSLGAVLCVILTGLPPFAHPDPQEVWRRNREGCLDETFVRLKACAADPALTALCRRCLAPHPDDRPRDAGELLWELLNAGGGRG